MHSSRNVFCSRKEETLDHQWFWYMFQILPHMCGQKSFWRRCSEYVDMSLQALSQCAEGNKNMKLVMAPNGKTDQKDTNYFSKRHLQFGLWYLWKALEIFHTSVCACHSIRFKTNFSLSNKSNANFTLEMSNELPLKLVMHNSCTHTHPPVITDAADTRLGAAAINLCHTWEQIRAFLFMLMYAYISADGGEKGLTISWMGKWCSLGGGW